VLYHLQQLDALVLQRIQLSLKVLTGGPKLDKLICEDLALITQVIL
jgi:hypothetical protein